MSPELDIILDRFSDFHFPPLGQCTHRAQIEEDNRRFPMVHNEKGLSPLMEAIDQNDTKRVRHLLASKKCCVLCQDADGNTALHHAARIGNLVVIRLLVGHGASLHAKNNKEKTALFCAAEHCHVAAIELLLELGLKPNARDWRKQTPLFSIGSSDASKSVAALKALLKGNACVDAVDDYGTTPLMHYSAQRCFEYLVGPLLEAGANVHARNQQGSTALGIAVHNGIVTAVPLLIAHGADKDDKRAYNSHSPLTAAVDSENQEMVIALTQAGANVQLIDQYHRSPIQTALNHGQVEIAKILKTHGAALTGIITKDCIWIYSKEWKKIETGFVAGLRANVDAIKALIPLAPIELIALAFESCPNSERVDYTLVNTAAECGRADALKLLLEKGIPMHDVEGNIPALAFGARKGSKEVLSYLLAQGAKFNRIPQGSDNELMFAVSLRTTEITEFILENCLTTETIEHSGRFMRRPIDVAIAYSRKNQIKLLIERGANLDHLHRTVLNNQVSVDGRTARQIIATRFPILLPKARK